MRSREQGVITILDPHGKQPAREFKSMTCAHCQRLVRFSPGEDPGGFCRMCMAPICGPCCDKGTCRPIEKWIDTVERDAYRRRQNAMVMGLEP